MTFSFDIPVWEVLITVVVSGIVTAVTIVWSVRAARRETMRAILANNRAEARARRDREREIADELDRSARRDRAVLAGQLLPRAEASYAASRSRGTAEQRRVAEKAAAEAWSSISNTFELSTVLEARQLYEWVGHRMKKSEEDAAVATSALDFVSATLVIDDIRRATLEWADTGHLPQAVAAEFEVLDAKARAKLRDSADELLRRILAIDAAEE